MKALWALGIIYGGSIIGLAWLTFNECRAIERREAARIDWLVTTEAEQLDRELAELLNEGDQ